MDRQTLDYDRAGQSHWYSRRSIWLIICVMLLLLAVSIFLPSLQPVPHQHYGRDRCAANLRQIGQGILLYRNENRGAYPRDLSVLMTKMEMPSETFVCPGTSDVWATGPTTQSLLDDFNTPGHCSYNYLGAGLTAATATSSTVVAYENNSNHAEGVNVLFGDGRVVTESAAWMAKLATRLALPRSTTSPVLLAPE